MSAADVSVGYPVHAVATFSEWENPHAARFTDWTAACGASGTASTSARFAFGLSGGARKAELCKACWPAGHATHQAKPRKVERS